MNHFEEIPALCSTIADIVEHAKTTQDHWLAARGLTMESARRLPKTEQARLSAQFAAWRRSENAAPMCRILFEENRFVVYKPNGARLDSRKTKRAAVALANKLFPSYGVIIESAP